MARRTPYALIYAPSIKQHLLSIEAKYHSLIREKIEEQLQYDPTLATTNRKPLRQPAAFAAEWEIRFGPENRFRVLYEVQEADKQVHILAIGVKDHDRLTVGGEEIDL